jgi:murein L,D-transpeptidase YcbB/YkuD
VAWTANLGIAQQDGAVTAALKEQVRRRDDTTARAIERNALERVYESPVARPRWLTVGGGPTRQALEAVEALASAHTYGLPVQTEEVALLRTLGAAWPHSPTDAAEFDVVLSQSLIRLLAGVRIGRVDPVAAGFAAPNDYADVDIAALLGAVATSRDVASAIASIEPRYAGYRALERALSRYRALAADTTVHHPRRPRSTIRVGDRYDDMPTLARFLAALGDLSAGDRVLGHPAAPAAGADSAVYDGPVVEALRRFQRRHGLDPDGVIGPATLAALRTPLTHRVRQIELALERWRWLPNRAPARFIAVNVPGFRLDAFENDSTAERPELVANVIVGRAASHKTPLFTATLREVVFRPYWDVPPKIARTELVPMFRRRPSYFFSDGFEIVRAGTSDVPAASFPLTSANLDRVASGRLRVRQRPGPANALGFVKFNFPNPYNVFLHDTPTRDLFAQTRRDFSHGCIRVAQPNELAEFVLRGQEPWDAIAIDSAMRGDRTLHVPLTRPIPVFVLYATAVAAGDGTVSFYPDLYKHDAALERLLGLVSPARE